MPDPNKLAKLEEIGYRVLPTCGTCKHARIPPGLPWGSCKAPGHEYEHAKHTGGPKPLSIHASGLCPAYEPNEKKAADLKRSGFERFEFNGYVLGAMMVQTNTRELLERGIEVTPMSSRGMGPTAPKWDGSDRCPTGEHKPSECPGDHGK